MALDDYHQIYEKYGNTGSEFFIRDEFVFAGDYTNEGEPDVMIEVQIAENPNRMADEIADMLNFGRSITRGAVMIANERTRQIEEEGYHKEQDAGHEEGELALAGAVYALNDVIGKVFGPETSDETLADLWPWFPEDFKPKKDRINNLVRAGALIAAEIDRLLAEQEKGA